ncbi:hypothetical protein E2562_036274 [Oryza meyeriana var. granulata]|uniref:Uncharacterized protein n=1 Tax=Oryza meyeriana var. granulata TaxID=110450 RepID=A0A6G1DT88_9ORYZ|nr:hypothetical protein E2562_036274 [Oryza meyeriana var. granulata]
MDGAAQKQETRVGNMWRVENKGGTASNDDQIKGGMGGIRELDNLSLRDLVKRQCTARLSTRRTTETITLPRTDETAHAITPYRREGTNWVNRSSAFYNSLRNRKNKCCKPLKTHA